MRTHMVAPHVVEETMITEWYAAYALEEGDEILTSLGILKIVLISPTVTGYRLMTVDEEGDAHNIDCRDDTNFLLICQEVLTEA